MTDEQLALYKEMVKWEECHKTLVSADASEYDTKQMCEREIKKHVLWDKYWKAKTKWEEELRKICESQT